MNIPSHIYLCKFVSMHFGIRLLATSEQFPKEHSKCPNVGGTVEGMRRFLCPAQRWVPQQFGCHPSDWTWFGLFRWICNTIWWEGIILGEEVTAKGRIAQLDMKTKTLRAKFEGQTGTGNQAIPAKVIVTGGLK